MYIQWLEVMVVVSMVPWRKMHMYEPAPMSVIVKVKGREGC
jgi:hypothetical protein